MNTPQHRHQPPDFEEAWLAASMDGPEEHSRQAIQQARMAVAVEADMLALAPAFDVVVDATILARARAAAWRTLQEERFSPRRRRRYSAIGAVAAMILISLGVWSLPRPQATEFNSDLAAWVEPPWGEQDDAAEIDTVESALDQLEYELASSEEMGAQLEGLSSELDELESEIESWGVETSG
jgi:hypothetical protein